MIGRQLLTSIYKHLNLILVYLLVLAHYEKCLLKKMPFITLNHKGRHNIRIQCSELSRRRVEEQVCQRVFPFRKDFLLAHTEALRSSD